jgi:hypothetical protein
LLEISAGLTDVAGVPAEVAALYYRVRFGGETAGEAEVGRAFPGDVVARLDGSGEKSMHPEFGRRVRMSGSLARSIVPLLAAMSSSDPGGMFEAVLRSVLHFRHAIKIASVWATSKPES